MVSQSSPNTAARADTLLKVTGLSWQADRREILSNIDFGLRVGEFVGIIGPNGAGKSSLMRCLYRVNRPSAGVVHFRGKDVWHMSAKESAQRIAVILQEHSEHLGLTVYDIVALGLTPHKHLFERDNAQDRVRIESILAQLDLDLFQNDLFVHLSGGEKQRVMLARAMLQQPELLVMDEPTNHLDVHYQVDMLQKVKALNLTVLASFHDLNLAAAFCDRLLVLDQGQLVADGTPAEVLTEALISRVFKTCTLIDRHPLYDHPRISYAYQPELDDYGARQTRAPRE